MSHHVSVKKKKAISPVSLLRNGFNICTSPCGQSTCGGSWPDGGVLWVYVEVIWAVFPPFSELDIQTCKLLGIADFVCLVYSICTHQFWSL